MSTQAAQQHAHDVGLPVYFDMQAKLGHTKHLGGARSTRELLELCEIGPEKLVLNVGSGAGVSATYIARTYGCRVFGIDLLSDMVASARQRAERKGVDHLLDFRVGDAQNIPFEDNRFDIVVCESVNTFIPDKAQAAAEYTRVLKPGGYVGLNEAIWFEPPTERAAATMYELTGERFLAPEAWTSLLADAGLSDVEARTYEVEMRKESRDQLELLGWGEYLRIVGRLLTLLGDPSTRAVLKIALRGAGNKYYDTMGYGLFVGRKPVV